MKQSLLLLSTIFILSLSIVSIAKAQDIQVVNGAELSKHIFINNDTTYVVNFFASWCKPCMKELPSFIKVMKELKGKKTKFLFVSLDFKKDYETNLLPVINNFHLPTPVYLFEDEKMDKWINSIDKNWSGTLPATLVLNTKLNYKRFIAEAVEESTLKQLLP